MSDESTLPAGSKQVFSNSDIMSAIDKLAVKLNKQLKDDTPVVLCVMQGGLIFTGQLLPKLNCMLEIDYIHATRYDNNTVGGKLKWLAYPATSLKDRSVLILDDILDEGNTLKAIIGYCQGQGAVKITSAVLLKKNHSRCLGDDCIQAVLTDNIALTIEDNYVFGYGMDYDGKYRQLDSIYALTDS